MCENEKRDGVLFWNKHFNQLDVLRTAGSSTSPLPDYHLITVVYETVMGLVLQGARWFWLDQLQHSGDGRVNEL